MKNIVGKQDLATNFDQLIEWVIFPKDHWNPEMIAEAKTRLFYWAGIFGVLLLKTDSQITGMSAFLMERLRVEVEEFRQRFGGFLTHIFRSASFRKNFPSAAACAAVERQATLLRQGAQRAGAPSPPTPSPRRQPSARSSATTTKPSRA